MTTQTNPKTVTVPSSSLCHAPTIIDFGRRALERGDLAGLDILTSALFDAPSWVVIGAVLGVYTVTDGGAVVFDRDAIDSEYAKRPKGGMLANVRT